MKFRIDKFMYMLAPIEDMTSNAFRSICWKYGSDMTMTELVRVEGLAKNNACTWRRLEAKDDTPTIIQLLGIRELYLKKFLKMFEPKKGFTGFNLNLGCPSPKVIEIGQGCAMVKRVEKTRSIVKELKDSGHDVSIKMRLGLNAMEKEKKAYINLIKAVDADFFVVHARHGGQSYHNPADFSVYDECVKTGKTIIANGDITNQGQIAYLKDIGVMGAMIGRAAVSDPTIFARLKGIPSPSQEEITKEFLALSEKYGEADKYRKNILKFSEIYGKQFAKKKAEMPGVKFNPLSE